MDSPVISCRHVDTTKDDNIQDGHNYFDNGMGSKVGPLFVLVLILAFCPGGVVVYLPTHFYINQFVSNYSGICSHEARRNPALLCGKWS